MKAARIITLLVLVVACGGAEPLPKLHFDGGLSNPATDSAEDLLQGACDVAEVLQDDLKDQRDPSPDLISHAAVLHDLVCRTFNSPQPPPKPEWLTRDPFAPKAGFVPDSLTAETIADAVLAPIYGYHELRMWKPYKMRLVDNIWIVEGTLHGDEVGDVFELWIRKTTGAILHLQLK
jgi:hypothetical protein